MTPEEREFYGQLVRMVWVEWAKEQPNPKPSWLLPWEELTEPEREVDRRIAEKVIEVATGGRWQEAIREAERDMQRRCAEVAWQAYQDYFDVTGLKTGAVACQEIAAAIEALDTK